MQAPTATRHHIVRTASGDTRAPLGTLHVPPSRPSGKGYRSRMGETSHYQAFKVAEGTLVEVRVEPEPPVRRSRAEWFARLELMR